MARKTLQQRIDEKTIKAGPDECWVWIGAKDHNGYGQIWDGTTVKTASRVVFLLGNPGANPECVCHTCDNRQCVNPAHLYGGTFEQNMHDRNIRKRNSYGMRNYKSVLTTEQVREVYGHFAQRVYVTGAYRPFAEKYKVSESCIRLIAEGKRRTSETCPA